MELCYVQEEDFELLQKLTQNYHTYKFFHGGKWSDKKVRERIHYAIQDTEKSNPNWFHRIICYNNQRIGYCSVHKEKYTWLLTRLILPEYTGKNIGTNIARFLGQKFNLLGIKISAYITPDNIASKKSLFKAGFKYIKTIRTSNGIRFVYKYGPYKK